MGLLDYTKIIFLYACLIVISILIWSLLNSISFFIFYSSVYLILILFFLFLIRSFVFNIHFTFVPFYLQSNQYIFENPNQYFLPPLKKPFCADIISSFIKFSELSSSSSCSKNYFYNLFVSPKMSINGSGLPYIFFCRSKMSRAPFSTVDFITSYSLISSYLFRPSE